MKKISRKKSKELNKLVSIDKIRRVIEILRDPDGGCPWDLKQDYNSIAPYSIEEAYELVNAIEKNDINEIKSELLIINANHSFEFILNNKEAIELGKN